MTWKVEQAARQEGRVAVVTGANSGLGFEETRALAALGAKVIMACRNAEKAARARDALLEKLGDEAEQRLEIRPLDLSDLESVRAFAEGFLGDYDRLDLLVNNAGVMTPPFGKTAQGFELQLGTNHLGHFALTGRLLPRLVATPASRVVNVASLAHKWGRIDFDDLHFERGYKPWKAYGQSKLANLLFTRELARRLGAAGHDVLAAAGHPGWSATNLQDDMWLARVGNPLFALKPAAGAAPILYAALAEDAQPGGYYGPRSFFELRGAPGPAKLHARAQDDEVAGRLWGVSEELTGVRYLE